jgi:hypothetical protein
MLKGMYTDGTLDGTPKDNYRFALNTVIESQYGEINALVNENSNYECLPNIGTIIGSLTINEYVILFYITPSQVSVISRFDPETCINTVLVTDTVCDLNFDINYPIQGTYKTLDYCNETIIYWVDGLNPVRKLNLFRIDEVEVCDDYNVFRCSKGLTINVTQVNDTGGSLMCGVYQFAIAYASGNFSYITNPISITDGIVIGGDYRYVDGCPAGTVTNKSISLSVTDINLNEQYFTIAIIRTVNGIQTFYELDKVQVNGSTYSFIYTGSEIHTAVLLNEILVPSSMFLSAWLIAQHQNRLMLGGVKQTRNINYQKFANEIKVNWITRKIKIDSGALGYKNPMNTYQHKSFMADEVYSLAVVVEFCDGTFSPAFHIPGNTPNECVLDIHSQILETIPVPPDPEILAPVIYTDPLAVVPTSDVNNFLGCEAPVWKIFNTACITSTPEEELLYEYDDCGNIINTDLGIWHKGELAYWEDCELYPEIVDCNGDPMYGDLAGTPVRYHRMPSRKLEPHFSVEECCIVEEADGDNNEKLPYTDTWIYPIELQITNVQMPDDSTVAVKKFHFVYVERNDGNKSVLAKGLTHAYRVINDANTDVLQEEAALVVNEAIQMGFYNDDFSYTDYWNTSAYKFHSPNTSISNYYSTKFKTTALNVTHLAADYQHRGEGQVYGKVESAQWVYRFNVNLNRIAASQFVHNRKVDYTTYVNANSIAAGVIRPINNTGSESGVYVNCKRISTALIPLDSEILPFTITCGGLTVNSPLVDQLGDSSWQEYQAGQEHNIDCAYSYYVALKNYKCTPYGAVLGQNYISTGVYLNAESFDVPEQVQLAVTHIAGDSFINYWAYRRTQLINDPLMGSQNTDPKLAGYDDVLPVATLIHTIVESDVNVELRHEGNIGSGEIYYPSLGHGAWTLDSSIPNGAEPQSSYLQQFRWDNDAEEYVGLGIDNYFNYNSDYSKPNNTRLFIGIGYNYKTCECNTDLNNTIVISDEDNYETDEDGWLKFRTNNYLNMPRHTGALMNIVTLSNNMYAHTENNLWRIFLSEDKLLTDTSKIYIGSGSIFGQTPMYLYAAEEGAMGLQQRRGTLLNEQGYFFIDNKSGTIFRYDGEKPQAINTGISNWLKETLTKLYPLENFTNPAGIGWHMTYDHRHNRVLITVKEFFPKFNIIQIGFKFYLPGGLTEVNLLDPVYFCNKSFTLSYSMLTQQFVSFHSYIPELYVRTRKDFFSAKTQISSGPVYVSGLWKHNKRHDYQTFYGTYYPHIIEIVEAHDAVKTWENIAYLQNAFEYNTVYNKEVQRNLTFDKAYVWNTEQNSGILALVNKTEATADYMTDAINDNTVFVNKKEQIWYFNQFTDTVVDYTLPHIVSECIDIIKDLPNTFVLGYKDYFNIADFRDTFVVYRLYKDNANHNKIRFVTKQLSTNAIKSYR